MKRGFSNINRIEGENLTSNSNEQSYCNGNDIKEPPTKLLAYENSNEQCLEKLLTDILKCVVCLELELTEIYQCENGHIMCESCFIRLLAETRIQNRLVHCPLCRVFISRKRKIRNRTAERIIAELPDECTYCHEKYPRCMLANHKFLLCNARPFYCKYQHLGCTWTGLFTELNEHQRNCIKLFNISPIQKSCETLDTLVEYLFMGRFFYVDLITKHYNSIAFISTVFYRTENFRAFDQTWAIIFKVIHPAHADGTCQASCKLILKSRSPYAMKVKFFILGNAQFKRSLYIKIHQHKFNSLNLRSDFKELSIANSIEAYRILAQRKFSFRFFMIIES